MAVKKLVGGDNLFFHPDVINFYNEVMERWEDNGKRVALFLGCSLHKPYSKSFMHRKIIGLLQKHELNEEVQQLIIGEPLVVCPREWENKYPAAHYEFSPEKLGEEGRKVFITRLKEFFNKINGKYQAYVIFAPNHHRKIITSACNGVFSPVIVPYNLYNLPKLLNVIENCYRMKNPQPSNHQ